MNLKRINRLLKLLQILQGAHSKNADDLARTCGVSRRTTFRDLETLRTAGVPLQFDLHENRYSIADTYFLPPTNLTAEETLSLIVLAGSSAERDQLPFFSGARRAALKLLSTLPASLREEVQGLSDAIHIHLRQTSDLAEKEHAYQQLVDAIAARRVVRVHYDSLTEWKRIRTQLRPYVLLYSHRSWYVIGRSSLHREVRTFNVKRIEKIAPLKSTYKIPASFSLERHLGNAWRLIPEQGKDYQVVIRFRPLVARNVAEVVWHKTQQIVPLSDGGIEFHATVSGLNEIVWWILGYGDQAEVLRPLRLRRLVAQRVARMRTIYPDAWKPDA